MCLLGLRQCIDAAESYDLLAQVFANLTVVQPVPMDSGLVKPDSIITFLSGMMFICLMLVMIYIVSVLAEILMLAIRLCFITYFLCVIGQVCMKLLLLM
jgi:hypothetical protein